MTITELVTGPLSVNTWCIPLDSHRMMVVDPGGNAELIITHLLERNATLSLILLTHGHFDHLTALPFLVDAFPEVDIAIHSDDAFFLGEGAIARHHVFLTELGAASLLKRYQSELPSETIQLAEGKPIVLRDGFIVKDWTVLHTPGHSSGSVCLYNESEHVLVSGDTLFNAGVGRTDAPGGSYEALSKSLKRLFALPPDTLVLPGHGAQTRISREC